MYRIYMKKLIITMIFVSIFVLGTGSVIHAHQLLTVADVIGNEVTVEAGFSNGDIAAGAKIIVTTGDGKVIAQGKTDEEGVFVFKVNTKTDLKIVVDAGAGHRAETTIAADEISISGSGEVSDEGQGFSGNNYNNLISLIDKTLAKRINPLKKEIQVLEHKAGMRDIIGSVGYIFGLMGVVLYFYTRRKKG